MHVLFCSVVCDGVMMTNNQQMISSGDFLPLVPVVVWVFCLRVRIVVTVSYVTSNVDV
jgi:hypothetical protein